MGRRGVLKLGLAAPAAVGVQAASCSPGAPPAGRGDGTTEAGEHTSSAGVPRGWALEFDAWVGEALGRRDFDALVDYRARAPGVERALPTHEHFLPLLVAAGASADRAEGVAFPVLGFAYGSGSKRSVQFG